MLGIYICRQYCMFVCGWGGEHCPDWPREGCVAHLAGEFSVAGVQLHVTVAAAFVAKHPLAEVAFEGQLIAVNLKETLSLLYPFVSSSPPYEPRSNSVFAIPSPSHRHRHDRSFYIFLTKLFYIYITKVRRRRNWMMADLAQYSWCCETGPHFLADDLFSSVHFTPFTNTGSSIRRSQIVRLQVLCLWQA